MSFPLTWTEARALALTGKAVRRDAWTSWFSHSTGLWWELDSTGARLRVVAASDLSAADLLANDWTDDPIGTPRDVCTLPPPAHVWVPPPLSLTIVDSLISPPSSLMTGLRAWWDLSEAAGTTRADKTGNGFDLSDHNSVDVAGSIIGGRGLSVAKFNGSNNYLAAAAHNILNNSSAFTVFAWVKQSDYSWFALADGSMQMGFGHGFSYGGTFYIPGPELWITDETDARNSWHLLAMSYNSSGNFKAYLNGVSVGSVSASGASLATDSDGVHIGCNHNATLFYGANTMQGPTGVYLRELSSSEITALYNGGIPLLYSDLGLGGSPGLVASLGASDPLGNFQLEFFIDGTSQGTVEAGNGITNFAATLPDSSFDARVVAKSRLPLPAWTGEATASREDPKVHLEVTSGGLNISSGDGGVGGFYSYSYSDAAGYGFGGVTPVKTVTNRTRHSVFVIVEGSVDDDVAFNGSIYQADAFAYFAYAGNPPGRRNGAHPFVYSTRLGPGESLAIQGFNNGSGGSINATVSVGW